MADVNVLVVFYSRYGNAEKLALAAGLGCIQANANIRLRRVADAATLATIEADRAWKENLDRMNRDYVAPRPADPTWADIIVLATPADSCAEIEAYVASLPSLGSMAGKLAVPITPGDAQTVLKPVYSAAACAGFIVAPAADGTGDALATVRAHGQRVARMARALKESR